MLKNPVWQVYPEIDVDNPTQVDRESYTCFTPLSALKGIGARRGELLEFEVVAKEHVVIGCYWLCTSLELLF
jgi:hypothetical protein